MTRLSKILRATALPLGLTLGLGLPGAASAEITPFATALITSGDNAIAGTATISETASGYLLLSLELTGVPSGTHAIHLHETGDCSAADYTSAGGHLSADRLHGVSETDGPHQGDLPNIHIGAEGIAKAEYFLSPELSTMLFDDDGTAFVMHGGADDYRSQPAGDAGPRIACGAFRKP